MLLDILYEDNHLLAINKPAGIATMGVEAGRASLADSAREYLKRKYRKPGNVYLGIVSRIDAPVSGVVIFARTSKAAARLTDQFRTRRVEKTYWAIVEGQPPPHGDLFDRIVKDETRRRMRIARLQETASREARLGFRRLASIGRGAWLEVDLLTGRKHQIRLQLASRGWAIFGDKKYGSHEPFASGIALHARRLSLDHPTRGSRLDIVANVPAAWRALGITE